MKKLVALAGAVCLAFSVAAQADSAMLHRISDEILLRGTCYQNLFVLCKEVGNRLSGSPAAAKAIVWGRGALEKAGADEVKLQPCMVPHWVRGKESLEVQGAENKAWTPMPMLSLGNAVGSDGKPVTADVVYATTLAAFNALPDSAVKGKIVFFDYRFRQDLISTFEAYGDAIWLRGRAPSAAARKGAVALIIRSLSTGLDDAAHTGSLWYQDDVTPIPAIAIGNTTADRLAEMCRTGAKARIVTSCKMLDPVLSYNVIGELRGSVHPEQYIVVGGHLDSWDVGEGAHDDGAGCVQAIEVLRTLRALGYKPRHTIRTVLFMNEENGVRGGRAYADSARSRGERHILAMESDAGGFAPRGIGLVMTPAQKAKVQQWAKLFLPFGVYDFDIEEGGVDIDPMGKDGVPLAGLLPDPQRYFDLHHSRNDVFEAVNQRELKLGAIVMAALVYLVDQYGLG